MCGLISPAAASLWTEFVWAKTRDYYSISSCLIFSLTHAFVRAGCAPYGRLDFEKRGHGNRVELHCLQYLVPDCDESCIGIMPPAKEKSG